MSEYDGEASIMRNSCPTGGFCAVGWGDTIEQSVLGMLTVAQYIKYSFFKNDGTIGLILFITLGAVEDCGF